MSAPRKDPTAPLSNRHAWARFRWIMRWVSVTAIAAVGAALFYLWADGSPLTVAVIIATCAGVSLSVLVGGGLMALIFLSAGSGHDAEVGKIDGPTEDPSARWDRRDR
ncbi:hypothetical protein [Rhizorhabdus sp. FW153]|uniref:hypothetical protein n=1 Tax=Rhizorhabdus sp. FW153 TaxID=3400216 RepID=UPI003CF4E4E0